MSTRSFAAAAAAAALVCAGTAQAAEPRTCVVLPPDKVALQMYSVFEAMTGPPAPHAPGTPFPVPKVSAAKLAPFLAELHAMGWRRFENFADTFGLPAGQYVAIVKASGLQVVSSHDNLDMAKWSAVLDRAKALGQTYVGSGGYGGPGLDSLEHVEATAANLNAFGAAAAKRGLKFFVHSHVDEIAKRYPYDLHGDGKVEPVSAWEIIAARTDPKLVSFEVDVAWAYRAFGPDHFEDLLAFLQRHRDRIVMLHIKDITADGKITDLGKGAIDFTRVVAAAGPQIRYYIWEYDHPPQPMASARIAYDFMHCPR